MSRRFLAALTGLWLCLLPTLAWAQDTGATDAVPVDAPPAAAVDTMTAAPSWLWLALFVVPLFLVLASAFVKVAVVLGLLRSAFGSADVPPALVVTALAVLLSVVVMAPVAQRVADAVDADGGQVTSPQSFDEAESLWSRASPPMLDFLEVNSSQTARTRFAEVVAEVQSPDDVPVDQIAAVDPRRLDVLLPAFVATELTEAFQMGLLLLLPFLVLDLVVAAVLQAGGLSTVRPAVVALPLKLLLFVIVDGWQLLLEALMLGYT